MNVQMSDAVAKTVQPARQKISLKPVDPIQHIASFALRFSVDKTSSVLHEMQQIPNCEIAHYDEHGHAILLFETEDSAAISDAHSALTNLDGVMNVNLVYHHMEDIKELDAVVSTEQEKASDHSA